MDIFENYRKMLIGARAHLSLVLLLSLLVAGCGGGSTGGEWAGSRR